MALSTNGRLGKGLGALIPKTKEEKEAIFEINLGEIVPNKLQPRRSFNDDSIEELAISIKENGIIQPIIVTRKNDKYEIIAGERRFRAANFLGLKKVPVIIKNIKEDKSLEIAIIENVQRENLSPLEEGQAYNLLMEKYGYTQEDLANKLGKNRATIANMIRLLRLPNELKEMLTDKKISSGHARALLAIKNEKEQMKLAKIVSKEKLSVRDIEKIVKEQSQSTKKIIKTKHKEMETKKLDLISKEENLKEFLGTKVKIKACKGNKGKIEIEFYSDGDLERILETIGII